MPTLFPTELLINLLTSHLAIDPNAATVSAVKATDLFQSFSIQSKQGNFVLQIAPADDAPQLFFEKGAMRQLPELHALIRARTTAPALEVAAVDFSRELIERDFVILEAKDGVPFGQMKKMVHEQYNRALGQFGSMLRQLHAIAGDAYGYKGPHRPMAPQLTWKQAFEVMWKRLIADIVDAGLYTLEEAERLVNLWDAHSHYFECDVSPVLLKMDMCTDHFLVDRDANLKAALNFEQALWGDTELDFAVLDYCGIYASSFWQGYGRPRPDTPESQIRRRFYLMYEMQKHIPISVWRANDADGAEQIREMVMAIAGNLEPQK